MPSLRFQTLYGGERPRYPDVVRGEVDGERCAARCIEIEAQMAVLQAWRVHGLAAAVHRNAHPRRQVPQRVAAPVEPEQHASLRWLRVEKCHRSALRSPARVDRQPRHIAGGDEKAGERNAGTRYLQEPLLASAYGPLHSVARV